MSPIAPSRVRVPPRARREDTAVRGTDIFHDEFSSSPPNAHQKQRPRRGSWLVAHTDAARADVRVRAPGEFVRNAARGLVDDARVLRDPVRVVVARPASVERYASPGPRRVVSRRIPRRARHAPFLPRTRTLRVDLITTHRPRRRRPASERARVHPARARVATVARPTPRVPLCGSPTHRRAARRAASPNASLDAASTARIPLSRRRESRRGRVGARAARQPRARPWSRRTPTAGDSSTRASEPARSRGRPPKPSAARLTMRGARASRRTNPPPASPTNARPSRPSPSPSQSPSPSPRTGQGPGPGQGPRTTIRPASAAPKSPRPRPNRTLARWRSDFSRRPPVAEDTVRSGAPWDGAATETGASSCTTRIAEDRIRKRNRRGEEPAREQSTPREQRTPHDARRRESERERERERAARRRARGVAEDDDLTRVTLARVFVVVVRDERRRIRLRHFPLLFPLLFARVVRVRSGDAFASPSADDPPR